MTAPFDAQDADVLPQVDFGRQHLRARFLDSGGAVFNVRAFGAVGDGVTDDTAAIQAAIDIAEVAGGIVFLPVGVYRTSVPLTIAASAVSIQGAGCDFLNIGVLGTTIRALAGFTGDALILDSDSSTVYRGIHIADLKLSGDNILLNAIQLRNDEYCIVERVRVTSVAQAGIWLRDTAGNVGIIRDVVVNNAVVGTPSGRIGAVTVEWADSILDRVEATTSSTDYSQSGNRVGILVTGANCFLSNCTGEISEDGIVVQTNGRCRLVNCRADLNRGHGFVLTIGSNQLANCLALNNGQQTDNTYDGFRQTGVNNHLVGCYAQVSGGISNRHRYGFRDESSSGNNEYVGCRSSGHGTATFNKTVINVSTPFETYITASPAALGAGDNNDYNPTDEARTLRLSANAAGSTLTGLTQGWFGRRLRIVNVSANTLTLAHQTTSTEINRLISPTGLDVSLAQDDVADLEYDGQTQRWRVVSVLQ